MNSTSHYQSKVTRRQLAKSILRRQQNEEDIYFDDNITLALAEDERTVYAKGDTANEQRVTIDEAHIPTSKPSMSLLQRGHQPAPSRYSKSTICHHETGTAIPRRSIGSHGHVRLGSRWALHQ